jgi:hypothetical protein
VPVAPAGEEESVKVKSHRKNAVVAVALATLVFLRPTLTFIHTLNNA